MSDVTLRNISPVGALEIPIARVTVEAGDTFTVSQEVAELLVPQVENYEIVSGYTAPPEPPADPAPADAAPTEAAPTEVADTAATADPATADTSDPAAAADAAPAATEPTKPGKAV